MASTHSPHGAPPASPDAYDLLAGLTAADDEYSHPTDPGGRSPLGLVLAVVLLGLLVTVAAAQTQSGAPQAERDRAILLERLEQEKAQVAMLGERADQAAAEVAMLRARTVESAESVQALQSRLDELGATAGSAAVRGPGVRVVVDNSADGKPEGTVLDTDLQQLVNGLWQAGAEAVAVNGQRLTTLSAIRTAGEAITVNYRSLSPPYVVAAIGDTDSLPARLLETDAGRTFADLRSNFGVRFEVQTRAALRLPAGSRLVLNAADEAPTPRAGR
ncbi:DUF881 domain-containing protein [soil metagenome]